MATRNKVDVDAVAGSFLKAFPKLNLLEQRLSLELYRLLASGEPVEHTLLAKRLGVNTETVTHILESWPGVFSDTQRRVVGYWVLSIPASYADPHQMMIDGQRLSAWCAWDTLFMPELLGKKITVKSASPISGATVSLTVAPEGVEQVDPGDTQMSFLLPDAASLQKDLLSAFCCFVHFFPTREAGETWVAQHDGTFLLSIDEGLAIAQRKNAALYREVLG